MQYFELIELLSLQLRLPQLVPNPSGVCAIRVDGMVFTFTHDALARSFEVSVPLGYANLHDPAKLQAMEAAGSADAARLRWDASGHTSLHQRFSLPALSFPHFFRALERFINQAEQWRQRIG
jgi:hypothetical protein